MFTLSSRQKAGMIKMAGTPVKEDAATYLGVTFYKRQTWKPHINHVERIACRKLSIMCKLAGTTWDANEQILKTIYQGTVRPIMEYSLATWSTTSSGREVQVTSSENQTKWLYQIQLKRSSFVPRK